MKTFIRGWEYKPPAFQDFVRLVFPLAFIAMFVFKGPVADVLLGGVLVLCCIVLVATNRRGWKHITPLHLVLVTALLVATVVDYFAATPVTHTAQRTVYWVFIVWYIATRFDLLAFWREGDFPESDRPF